MKQHETAVQTAMILPLFFPMYDTKICCITQDTMTGIWHGDRLCIQFNLLPRLSGDSREVNIYAWQWCLPGISLEWFFHLSGPEISGSFGRRSGACAGLFHHCNGYTPGIWSCIWRRIQLDRIIAILLRLRQRGAFRFSLLEIRLSRAWGLASFKVIIQYFTFG